MIGARLIMYWLLALCLVRISEGALAMEVDFDSEQFYAPNLGSLNYRIHRPANVTGVNKLPLIVFLHGAGERGDDNQRQLIHGARDILAYTQSRARPAIILAPQVPDEERWVDTPWDLSSHSMPANPSRSMSLLMGLLQQLLRDEGVDSTRVYVTGLSMGGYGTWDLIQRWPDVFAAAIPICGGGDTAMADRIKHIPIWAFHGSEDPVVIPERSRDMIAALKGVGSSPVYTEYEGVFHDSWTPTYQNPKVLDWLFSQHLAGDH